MPASVAQLNQQPTAPCTFHTRVLLPINMMASSHYSFCLQIRQFQPKLVAIKDASKVAELKELIKDVPQQPEILVSWLTHSSFVKHAE